MKQTTVNAAAGGRVWSPGGSTTNTARPTTLAKLNRSKKLKAIYNSPFLGISIILIGLAFYIAPLAIGVTGLTVYDTWTKTVKTFTVTNHYGSVSGWWVFAGIAIILAGVIFLGLSVFKYEQLFTIAVAVGALFLVFTATGIVAISTDPDAGDNATTWIQEQVGTKAQIPDSFSMDKAYSYHVYGPQTGNWTVKIVSEGNKRIATLTKDAN